MFSKWNNSTINVLHGLLLPNCRALFAHTANAVRWRERGGGEYTFGRSTHTYEEVSALLKCTWTEYKRTCAEMRTQKRRAALLLIQGKPHTATNIAAAAAKMGNFSCTIFSDDTIKMSQILFLFLTDSRNKIDETIIAQDIFSRSWIWKKKKIRAVQTG